VCRRWSRSWFVVLLLSSVIVHGQRGHAIGSARGGLWVHVHWWLVGACVFVGGLWMGRGPLAMWLIHFGRASEFIGR
jgi:hypothetical protein